MPKLVDSMFKVFRREKKGQKGMDKNPPRSKRANKSVLDADSFIFVSGGTESQYWGELMNNENFPFSQLGDAVASRRKTHIGLVQSGESNGMQEVNLIISPDVSEKDGNLVLNGKLFNRRLSGTLVKASKSDLMDDEPVLRDYAFLLSARERLSQEFSGRYVTYDRLVRSPLLSARKKSLPTKTSQQQSNPQWNYPSGNKDEIKSPRSRDLRSNDDMSEVVLRRTGPTSSTPVKDSHLLGVNRDQLTCSVRDAQNRREQKSLKRPLSGNTVDSQGYSNLEFTRSVAGSEYAMPQDAINWQAQEIDPYEVVGMREYHTIPPQDLLLGEKIGEGQFGDVHNGYLYPKTMDEIDVAIKTCKPDASHEDKVKFLEEAAVMCKFRHPNIIKLYGVVSHMDLAYIVMELAPHGQLRRYLLLEGSRITRLMLLGYIAQMASAMVHLEDMNYVHRDIAARNILVCTPQVIKLADFGLSRGLEDGDYYVASRGKLPIKWMAPESINFRRFTGLSDVWMFGVCCWEVLMRGVKPFVGIKNDEVISKIESGERLALPVECPATLYMLMNMCWRYDPLERPRFVEIEARLNEIIEEELPVDQMSGRRFVGGGQIQRDPEAPAKPHRHTRTPPMVRVPSDSPGGLGARGSLAVPYPSEGGQQVVRVTEKVEWQREDLPPLPPRPMERFRDLSTSPPGQRGGGRGPSPILGNVRNSSHPPQSHDYHLNRESRQPNHALPPPPHIVPPYSVTTLSPASDDQERHTMQIRPDSPSSAGRQSHMAQSDSPLGGYHANSHIPPPAILSQHPNHQPRGGGEGGGIYYSTPAEIVEKKQQQRVLTKEGVFMSRDVGSPLGSMDSINNDSREQGVRPKLGEDRPISHASTGESSGMSSPALPDDKNYPTPSNYESHYETQYEESFTLPDEDEILKLTMGVVKTVKELSDRVHKSKPNDYVDLVKNVGLALRDLLGKVDGSLNKLPPETHTEVTMAQKVLSSDMNQLVSAMKDAQAHYDKFLEQEYQKKMLKAAHVVAVNSKLLLDAINSAKRKAHLMR